MFFTPLTRIGTSWQAFQNGITSAGFAEEVFMEEEENYIPENSKDRTTITLHPVGSRPIRLSKWKEVWNHVIKGLPIADGEMVPNVKSYRELSFFRNKQDFLRKKQ